METPRIYVKDFYNLTNYADLHFFGYGPLSLHATSHRMRFPNLQMTTPGTSSEETDSKRKFLVATAD
jgi:hypothetical protein